MSREIMELLTALNQQGTTIAVVTHDATVAAQTKRVIQMQDGVIVEAGKVATLSVGPLFEGNLNTS